VDFKDIDFFNAESLSETKDIISDLIYSNDRGIFIISGENGVGKSRLIKSIVDEVQEESVFLITEPPRLEKDLLEDIYYKLRNKHFSRNVKINEMKVRVNDAFKKINHTIIIDNIHEELSPLIDEIGRSIHDIRDLKILIVVDKVFATPQDLEQTFNFTARENILIDKLSEDDFKLFITEFVNIKEIEEDINFIYTATNGNIGKLEKMINTSFEIIEVAKKENIIKFNKLDKCILVMSALENEFING